MLNTDWNTKIKNEACRRKARILLEEVADTACETNKIKVERAIELLWLQRHIESELFSCIGKALDEEMGKL